MNLIPKSYNIEISKNYLFSFFNLFIRMSLSLIAIPILSNTPDILAIYSICISLAFFFGYSDFGFIAAGKKYASEYVISKDFNLQLRFLGNSFSFSFLISCILSASLFIISFSPEVIISELEFNSEYSYIASILLKTLSISSLLQIFSNYITSIFSINLKKYYCDIVSTISAMLSLSIFFLINKTNNDWILLYYISLKLFDFLTLLTLIILSNRIFKIKIFKLISNFRIRKSILNSSLKLSITSIISSMAVFMFYELDNLFLARNLDLSSISFFVIAALGPLILKIIIGTFYSPFNSIFNYVKIDNTLYKKYFNKVVVFFFPITFIGILVVILFSEEIIYSYVGSSFQASILPFIYLCLPWSFSFIFYPTNIYLFTKEFHRRIIICVLIPPIIFWAGNIFFVAFYGNITLHFFCLNKMYSSLTILPFYFYYLIKDNFIEPKLLVKIIKSLFFSILILLTFYFLFKHTFYNEKSIIGLIFNIGLMGGLMLFIKLVDLRVNKNQIDL